MTSQHFLEPRDFIWKVIIIATNIIFVIISWSTHHVTCYSEYSGEFQKINTDFCNMETFNATCPQHYVIFIDDARYGRMRIGRCMKLGYGNQGCSSDVTNHLNSKCAGRPVCKFQVPDKEMYQTKPCSLDFTSYLEVTFLCIPVVVRNHTACLHASHQKITSVNHGYVISHMIPFTDQLEDVVGGAKCPWVIEALPGQRINLTLHSVLQPLYKKSEKSEQIHDDQQLFHYGTNNNDNINNNKNNNNNNINNNNKACFDIGHVVDGSDGKRPITVCENDPATNRHVMLTTFHVIRVEFINIRKLRDLGVFILEFSVVGCPNFKPSPNSWHQRSGDTLTVRCNHTSKIWQLKCRDHEWWGDVGNCSNSYSDSMGSWSLGQMFNAEESFPFGVLLAVSIGVAMGIVIGGFLLCLITLYLKRQRQHNALCGGYSSPKEQQVQPRFPVPISTNTNTYPSSIQMTRLNALNTENQPLHNNWLVLDSRDCINSPITNNNDNNGSTTYQSSCLSNKVARKPFQAPVVVGLDDSLVEVASVLGNENILLAGDQKIYHHDYPCLNTSHSSPQRYYSQKALSDMPKANNADLLNFKNTPTFYETSCFS